MSRIISRDTLAQTVPARWADRYESYPAGAGGDHKRKIMTQLLELKAPISPDEVDRIIGNTSWTAVPDCDQCARSGLEFVFSVGGGRADEYDYEHDNCVLCRDCLKEMSGLAEAHQVKSAID